MFAMPHEYASQLLLRGCSKSLIWKIPAWTQTLNPDVAMLSGRCGVKRISVREQSTTDCQEIARRKMIFQTEYNYH
ncbi:hypothetical protein GDO81_004320 [Engystomops pustulosus]|uniref:Uncharacterized protein n=1 Tax=Engystomops pustulosus TaxID=76066 RepID=A0AAV6ZTT3_ENGPU|nr:hypothetical protein GDO81_004320 [Engystomops pustulosus]